MANANTRNIKRTMMQLDSGLKVANVIAELAAERERFAPTFDLSNASNRLAFINVFGAFK